MFVRHPRREMNINRYLIVPLQRVNDSGRDAKWMKISHKRDVWVVGNIFDVDVIVPAATCRTLRMLMCPVIVVYWGVRLIEVLKIIFCDNNVRKA